MELIFGEVKESRFSGLGFHLQERWFHFPGRWFQIQVKPFETFLKPYHYYKPLPNKDCYSDRVAVLFIYPKTSVFENFLGVKVDASIKICVPI